jgi:hypothetical protein
MAVRQSFPRLRAFGSRLVCQTIFVGVVSDREYSPTESPPTIKLTYHRDFRILAPARCAAVYLPLY